IASPKSLWPPVDVVEQARSIAKETGAQITITEDVDKTVRGCDVLLTDVWVSMGEAEDVWAERIELLKPYQVNAEVLAATANPDADRKSTRLNSSHSQTSYAVFCLKKKRN